MLNNNFIIKKGIKIMENESKHNPIAERKEMGFKYITLFIAFYKWP